MTSLPVFAVLFLSLWTSSQSACSSEIRVRKPWHSLTDEEQMLYVNGFQQMAKDGTLQLFLESHDDANTNTDIHGTAQNFFWHSYWLYELECSFRDLGPEYECFTLPYWDVSVDEEVWANMDDPKDISALPIYNSNLGGEGSLDNNYCVMDDPWTVSDYTTEYLCADDEVSPDCCLKRYHTDEYMDLASRATLAGYIFMDRSYEEFDDYSIAMNDIHGNIHLFIGSVDDHTHFNSDQGEPEVDPLFPLFHSFITYLTVMRADCNQFDLVDATALDEYIPYSYSGGPDCTLDYEMTFSILCDGSDGEGKRMCSSQSITPRMMYDISPSGPFKVQYELGDFWSKNEELRDACLVNLNPTWWSIENTDTDAATDAVFADQGEKERSQFVSDRATRSVVRSLSSSPVSLQVIAFMVIGIAAVALLRLCVSRSKKMEIMDGVDGNVYGAI